MSSLLVTFLAGVLGTATMTIFLLAPRWLNIGHLDVVRAVGALITKREDGAFKVGLAVHLLSGIVFAYIYYGFLTLSRLPVDLWTGIVVGAAHGAIVMLFVCISIMEHHPIQKYHRRGPMTGVMQFAAHVIYGAVVGSVIHWLAPQG